MPATHVVELPQENHSVVKFFACRACATHALSLASGGVSYPTESNEFSCELFYEGICTDKPSIAINPDDFDPRTNYGAW